MRADGRSLHQLARDANLDVTALSRFGNGIRGLSMPAADALAVILGLDYRPVRASRQGKRKAGKGSKQKGR
jgi:hypothetical protein